MQNHTKANVYEGLASYFLPEGALDFFELTKFEVVPTKAKGVLYKTELHIYLDERDNRSDDMKEAVSNGFSAESKLLDFPTRDKKTVLHIRRRRWTMPDKTTRYADISEQYSMRFPNTRYAKSFALFLKGED